jgi:hypothetical protein
MEGTTGRKNKNDLTVTGLLMEGVSRSGQKGLSVTFDSGFAGGRRIASSDDWRRRGSLWLETSISRLSAGCRHGLFLIAGCGSKNDAVSQAEKTKKDRASIGETKDIVEQGFIFGLPLVMNYAIITAYSTSVRFVRCGAFLPTDLL